MVCLKNLSTFDTPNRWELGSWSCHGLLTFPHCMVGPEVIAIHWNVNGWICLSLELGRVGSVTDGAILFSLRRSTVQCCQSDIHRSFCELLSLTIDYTAYMKREGWGDAHCTVYSVKCTCNGRGEEMHSVQCTVYSVQCTLYTVQCIV